MSLAIAKEFCTEVKKVERAHKDAENALHKISRTYESANRTGLFENEKELLCLVKLYEECRTHTEKELRSLEVCLHKLASVSKPDSSAMSSPPPSTSAIAALKNGDDSSEEEMVEESPLKKRKNEAFMRDLIVWRGKGNLPPLCGCVPPPPKYIVPIGDQVAAKIQGKRGYENPEWILASVVKFFAEKQRYEIEDEDHGEEDNPIIDRKHYFVPAKSVIPLPKYEPENWVQTPQAAFPKNTFVLALFPGTTSFYKARVESTPRRRKHQDYVLQFDDDEGERGGTMLRRVPVQFVVAFPS
eukprot:TRINITY_DN10026_c0_g1_i4.p1 TRINITY_DN10026_c0_g1~~TRINITY_DN10026_c0_g1_i4.p1  ORF type:complete len:299 (-),score=67.28 TRINITY_DN10026_c0_g1_i4:133-1029(-)